MSTNAWNYIGATGVDYLRQAVSAPDDALVTIDADGNLGLVWTCGDCGRLTDEAHYVMDRATGKMLHEADKRNREYLGNTCGARYTMPNGRTLGRCTKQHDHPSSLHQNGAYQWTDTAPAHVPPYDENLANASNEVAHGG